MSNVTYRSDDSYVSCRAGVYYYIIRVTNNVRQHYAAKRLSFILKTKSHIEPVILFWCLVKVRSRALDQFD